MDKTEGMAKVRHLSDMMTRHGAGLLEMIGTGAVQLPIAGTDKYVVIGTLAGIASVAGEPIAALDPQADALARRAPAPADERATFEAWVKTRLGYPFAGTFTNLMWDAWQARAAHRAASASASVDERSTYKMRPVQPYGIGELLGIYDACKGDWCAIARAVETRYIAELEATRAALAHQAAPAQPSAAQDAQNSPPRPLRSPDGIMGAAAAVRATERIDAMHKGVVGVFATIKAEHLAASPACAPAAAPTSDQQAGACDCCKDIREAEAVHGDGPDAAPAAIEQAGARQDADLLRIVVEQQKARLVAAEARIAELEAVEQAGAQPVAQAGPAFWYNPEEVERERLTDYADQIRIVATSIKFGHNTSPLYLAAPAPAADQDALDAKRLDWMAGTEFLSLHQYISSFNATGQLTKTGRLYFAVECEPGGTFEADTIREAIDAALAATPITDQPKQSGGVN